MFVLFKYNSFQVTWLMMIILGDWTSIVCTRIKKTSDLTVVIYVNVAVRIFDILTLPSMTNLDI